MEPEDQVTARPPLVGIAVVSVIGVLLVGALVYLASERWSGGNSAFASTSSPAGGSQPSGGGSHEADTLAAIRAQKAAELEAEQSSAAVQARLDVNRLMNQVGGVESLVGELDAELLVWREKMEPLLANDAGKRVAANEALTRTFMAAWHRTGRPTSRDTASLKSRVATVRGELERILAAEPVSLPEQTESVLSENLDMEERTATKMLERLKNDRRALEDIVARAHANSPSDETLQRVMETLERTDAADELAATIAREDAARAAKEERENAIAEEEARLRRIAEDPDVQKLYSAFITKGSYSPRANYHEADKAFIPPKGVSVSDLRDWDVLSNVEHFQAFARCKQTARGHMFDRNKRTPLNEPEPKTSEEWDVWQQRMDQFNELVPIYREMGLLEP